MNTIPHILPHVSRLNKAILALIEPTRQAARLSKNKVAELPFIPTPALLRRFPGGNSISKFFRHIFEHSKIHRVLGGNLALAVIASSILQFPGPSQSVLGATEAPVVIKSEKISFATEKGVQFPLKNVKINQKFYLFHPGVDFDGNTGDPVKPIMPGRVQSTQYSRFAYGNAIIVNHGNAVTSLYAHLSKVRVSPGDEVTMETIIGDVGSTGRSTGDHLHLEVREDSRAINPLTILPAVGSSSIALK